VASGQGNLFNAVTVRVKIFQTMTSYEDGKAVQRGFGGQFGKEAKKAGGGSLLKNALIRAKRILKMSTGHSEKKRAGCTCRDGRPNSEKAKTRHVRYTRPPYGPASEGLKRKKCPTVTEFFRPWLR